jgi:ferric-dicitrate binding protein FerR (iron transport regulator)
MADPLAGSAALAQVSNVVEVYPASEPGWRRALEQEVLMPGDRLRSGPDGFALVQLPRGVTLRVDEASEFELLGEDRVFLQAGAVYVDAPGIGTLGVDTEHGSARDIGTQYEVRLLDAGWQVSVRDGAVVMDDASRGEVQAVAGERLIVAGGEVERRIVGPSDVSWDWTHEALRPMAIEGRTLSTYLDWWSRESGVRVVYAKPIDASLAGQTRLHGDLGELSLDDGFRAVIAGAGFRVVDRDEQQVIVTN